jgi:hypothetical protein
MTLRSANSRPKQQKPPVRGHARIPVVESTTEDTEYSDPDGDDSESESDCDHLPKVDIANLSKPQHVAQYAERICLNAQALEGQLLIPADSFERIQYDVTPRNRRTVVNWLIRVHFEWQMMSETLFNAIYCFDYVLSQVPIPKSDVQLLGAVCLWMCAKLDEIHYPSVHDFKSSCRMAHARVRFEDYEKLVFQTLHFNVKHPTSKGFLARFLAGIAADGDVARVADFVCEVSLMSFATNQFTRSIVAFSAIVIAFGLIGRLPRLPVMALLAYAHLAQPIGIVECAALLLELVAECVRTREWASWQRYCEGTDAIGRLAIDRPVFEAILEKVAQCQTLLGKPR